MEVQTMAGSRSVTLPSGEEVPALGQGTWYLGDDPRRRSDEIAALRLGLDLGMTVIDTAEMYGDGAAEELVGEAFTGRRDEVVIVDKVLPHHATCAGTVHACRETLRRLGTDRIDLYLLHWRGRVPLAETLAGFTDLLDAGAIRSWGVSNFDRDDMAELYGPAGGRGGATHQNLQHPPRRRPGVGPLPWCAEHGVPVMAYSPIEQGRLLDDPALGEVARRHGATPVQIALAWTLRRPGTIALPRSCNPAHVQEDAAARDITLTGDDLAALDAEFPPPRRQQPLEML